MNQPKLTIVDYGVGNLSSLKRAFNFCGVEAIVSEEPEVLRRSEAIVLPGVGAFEAGMRGLQVRGLVETIKELASLNKPMLGICLGAQLMLGEGQEFGVFKGLNLIPGKVVRFPELVNNEKIPQIGWNSVYWPADISWDMSIFNSLGESFDAYFVHSYVLAPDHREHVFSLSTYGGYEFCSAIKMGNIYGCQFHPEKSGQVGLAIIKNFISLI